MERLFYFFGCLFFVIHSLPYVWAYGEALAQVKAKGQQALSEFEATRLRAFHGASQIRNVGTREKAMKSIQEAGNDLSKVKELEKRVLAYLEAEKNKLNNVQPAATT